jgi:hypothetical protein
MGKLTDLKIKHLKPQSKPYKVFDGDGLYLLVTPKGSKLWRLDYRYCGKRKTLALGKYPEVSLLEAREKALEAKKLLAKGEDPSFAKKLEKEAKANTFEIVAKEFIEKIRPVRAPSHVSKLESRLKNYLLPWIGSIPINEIKSHHILNCAKRAEAQGKIETAHRIVQLAGQIIRYAISTGRAEIDPTASLKGALTPSPKRHYPAIVDPQELSDILRTI